MKIKNRAISTAFKKAKKHLIDCTFICVALNHYCDLDYPCESIVKERMEGYYTLETWLESRGIIILARSNYREEMLEYRHRWLDELIKEFDVDGYYEG
jgi:hypothetical protein